jgi:hypothetical protein
VTVSERQMALARALNTHRVSELPDKRHTIELVSSSIAEVLRSRGLGSPYEENWMVVEDSPLTFISGSAPKTRTDTYGFLFVFSRDSGLVYYEVGNTPSGTFPSGARVIQ